MPYPKKKIRPSTASGVIQTTKVAHILDDHRPSTAIGKTKESYLGLEPTFITAQHSNEGFSHENKYFGKQVHGGIDKHNLKDGYGRRATIGPGDNFELLTEKDQPKRPLTGACKSQSQKLKIEERITLEHLNKMKQAFEEADDDNSGTLDLEEFKNVFKYFLGLKGANEHQMVALFMKIDSSSDGEINWNEFCTYMQLEYAEKEESYFRAKETAFYLPATMGSSPHRDTVLRMSHTNDNTFLSIGQDGLVSFWTPSMVFKRTKQIENGSKKNKWITDFILMPQYNKFIIATGDREIQFHELSTFEGYCQISALETVPLTLDYCFTGSDECLLLYGDSEGCICILIMKNVGELLRLWKKMPLVEGIANINIDSVAASENVKFVRWKVHNDWVQELRYYHSIRSVISCSSDSNHSLVIGQTLGSTHVNNQSKDTKKLIASTSVKDITSKRRLSADETVFRIYKGVKTFDFSKIKNIMVTGGMDRLIRLWNPYVPGKPTGILRGHVTPIFYLFIVEEDNRLFSISNDKTVKVWDVHDQTCLLTVRPKSHLIKGELTAVHYNPISRGLAIATDHIALLKLKSKPLSMQMTTTHKDGVTYCCYNKSFNHVVTSCESSVIKVWDMESGSQVFEYSKVHDDTPVTCLSFDSTERRLLTSGQDGKVKIWNYNNGHCLNTLQTERELEEITNMVYFTINKNRYIVSVGWDRRINLYSDDQDSLHHIKTPFVKWPDDRPDNGHKEDILGVAYSPPNFLATSSYDGEVLVWNVTSGRIFTRLNVKGTFTKEELLCGELAVSRLLFFPSRSKQRDAATLVTNGPKAQIHFWNIFDSNQPYAHFSMPNDDAATYLTTTTDNQLLIATDEKGFVIIWDVSEYCCHGKEVQPPPVHKSWRAHIKTITSAVFVPKHDCLLTSSIDCTVRCWTIEGHFIGTFGQPKMWDIYDVTSYQHPMAPYDVLMDPSSLPSHPSLHTNESAAADATKDCDTTGEEDFISNEVNEAIDNSVEDIDIKELMEKILISANNSSGKRLRHAKLKTQSKKSHGGHPSWSASSAYKSLSYYELEEVPTLP